MAGRGEARTVDSWRALPSMKAFEVNSTEVMWSQEALTPMEWGARLGPQHPVLGGIPRVL